MRLIGLAQCYAKCWPSRSVAMITRLARPSKSQLLCSLVVGARVELTLTVVVALTNSHLHAVRRLGQLGWVMSIMEYFSQLLQIELVDWRLFMKVNRRGIRIFKRAMET